MKVFKLRSFNIYDEVKQTKIVKALTLKDAMVIFITSDDYVSGCKITAEFLCNVEDVLK